MLPSPNLGGAALAEPDDPRRLRALLVERLRGQQADVFVAGDHLIQDINERLGGYPAWKRHQFTPQYLEADRDDLEGALVIREMRGKPWVYLKEVYDDERLLEEQLRRLEGRPDIGLKAIQVRNRPRVSDIR